MTSPSSTEATRQIFHLHSGWYNNDQDFFLYAPVGTTIEEFKTLCDKLLPEAARQCMKFGAECPDLRGKRELIKTWIGWSEITEELTLILPQYGYEVYEPPCVQYNGTSIIRKYDKISAERGEDLEAVAQIKLLGDAWEEVCNYNQSIENEGLSRKKKDG